MPACCEPSEFLPGRAEPTPAAAGPRPWFRFAIALVLAGLSMQLSLGVNLSPVSGTARLVLHGGLALAAVVVFALLGGPIWQRSFQAARRRRITLEQLFLLGISGALAASVHSSVTGAGAIYYEVIGVLVTVYTLGQLLVERQRRQVRTSLHRLTASLRTAVRLTCCGKRFVVPVAELKRGDRVLVEKGQRLPVDGVIAEGMAYVQETSQTGEPFPAAKAPGDAVLAGTVALDGDLILTVSQSGKARELDRIAARLESALERRAGWLREADRWMAWFVPSVAMLALGTFTFWLWRSTWEAALFNSLAVLLVACPCGLGLGIPIALWHVMQRLANLGIAVDGSELIERLARVRAVVFDKTGTLTEETLRLHALIVLEDVDAEMLRARLALIESHCDHPVARPFSTSLRESMGDGRERLGDVEALPGQGIRGQLTSESGETTEIVVGNGRLLGAQHEIALATLRRDSPGEPGAHRELFVFTNGQLVALALLAETVRPALDGVVPRLRALGLQAGIMTGDASPNERQWAEQTLPVSSGMTPWEKAAAVQAMEQRGDPVLFIGDGLNDAEAMAAATASLAMAGGDSTARAHAQGELTTTSLRALPEAVAASRAACATVRTILGVSLVYNAAGLVLAATGWLHPVVAAAIMFASSISVVAIAARGAEGAAGRA